MRSFLGKIFLCMLLVPILARSFGYLLEATLSDPRPQSERTLAAIMPGVAQLAGATLQSGGEAAVQRALQASAGSVKLLHGAASCASPPRETVVVEVPGQAGTCLSATPPPRALVLGVVPASWWFLLPVLELLCAGVVSFFLARYLAKPILRTSAAASAFAGGDLNARAMPAGSRRDEAADLEQDFNRMADRVAAMIAAQQRFIGDVSHEVRSPLGRLALTLGLARREAGPALAPRLDRMEQEIDGISALVNELLVLASLQGSVRPPTSQKIDVPDMLERLVDDLSFEFQDRGHTIRTICRPAHVAVNGDAALLRRAVDNVLRNALFYTPDNTDVEALVESDGAWMRLVVRDHGPGVPEAALPQLFEPFFRVDQARARDTGGVGLGLAITQRAVQLHGGRVRAMNAHPHGLAVRIDLPVA